MCAQDFTFTFSLGCMGAGGHSYSEAEGWTVTVFLLSVCC